jgi:hypothetical protein
VVVRFIGRGNRSDQRKPPTRRKSLTNFITSMLYPVHLEWESNYHTFTTAAIFVYETVNVNCKISLKPRLWLSVYINTMHIKCVFCIFYSYLECNVIRMANQLVYRTTCLYESIFYLILPQLFY